VIPASLWPGARIAAVLGALSVAFAAGFWTAWSVQGHKITEAKLEAAEKLVKGWETAERVNRNAVEKYATDLAAVRDKPPRVVRVCANSPGASGGTVGPAPGVADSGLGEDIGPTLTACLTELYRYRSLSSALQPQ